MLSCQRNADFFEVIFAFLLISAEVLLEQHILQNQLRHFCRHGAELEGSLIGAAAQNHIRQLGGRGFGEPGDENGGDSPCLGQFQHGNTVMGGAGVGEEDDDIILVQGGHRGHHKDGKTSLPDRIGMFCFVRRLFAFGIRVV